MSEIANVTVVAKSNVYFDGKCVSHTLIKADGGKTTVGVIFPASLRFNTGAPERMEVVSGECKVRLDGASTWQTYRAGDTFSVPGNSSFDIEVSDGPFDYICHFE
ncbi:MAG: pyrimidine/purine nucleoside phosphorylase [Gammaproteobacteria bacterium]|nr:pyrimidine/purine nucleoside phosphorylase [Gammaproteobacteria bacterium]